MRRVSLNCQTQKNGPEEWAYHLFEQQPFSSRRVNGKGGIRWVSRVIGDGGRKVYDFLALRYTRVLHVPYFFFCSPPQPRELPAWRDCMVRKTDCSLSGLTGFRYPSNAQPNSMRGPCSAGPGHSSTSVSHMPLVAYLALTCLSRCPSPPCCYSHLLSQRSLEGFYIRRLLVSSFPG